MDINFKLYYLLLLICILSIGVLFYKKITHFYNSEGFSQNEKFILEKDENIYDEFYSEIYDQLHLPHKRVPFEVNAIIQNTQCTPEHSSFLDIGSGTGDVLIEFEKKGFQIIGIDKSKPMIQRSLQKCGTITVENADVENPMAFDKYSFTHVLCLYYTIYHFQNKKIFFNNCYKWIKPGGFLIVHLVDKNQFDTTIPINKYLLNNIFKKENEIKNSENVDFGMFTYKRFYNFYSQTPENGTSSMIRSSDSINLYNNKTIITETFTDKISNNIRQNELTLYMENIDIIINIAKLCGFIPNGVFNLKKTGDEYQYMYFFERSL